MVESPAKERLRPATDCLDTEGASPHDDVNYAEADVEPQDSSFKERGVRSAENQAENRAALGTVPNDEAVLGERTVPEEPNHPEPLENLEVGLQNIFA